MGTWGWPSRGWPEQGAAPPACSAWTQAPRCSQQCGELWLSPALCPDLRGGEARLVLTDTDLPAEACVSAGHGRQAGRGCNSAYGRSLLGDPRDIWGAQSEGRARAPFLQARGEGTRLAVTGVVCWGPRSQGPTPPTPQTLGAHSLRCASSHREEATAAASSVLARRIPWTEESGRPHSVGSVRVRQDCSN